MADGNVVCVCGAGCASDAHKTCRSAPGSQKDKPLEPMTVISPNLRVPGDHSLKRASHDLYNAIFNGKGIQMKGVNPLRIFK